MCSMQIMTSVFIIILYLLRITVNTILQYVVFLIDLLLGIKKEAIKLCLLFRSTMGICLSDECSKTLCSFNDFAVVDGKEHRKYIEMHEMV